jgi:hypothetical protein
MDKSRGHLPVDPPTVARLCPRRVVRSAPRRRARAGTVRALHAVWVAMWAIHTLRQAAPRHHQAARTVHVPVDSFFNRNPLLFYFEFILDSKFENSYLDIQSYKNYETSSVGFIIL